MSRPKIHFTLRIDPSTFERLAEVSNAKGAKPRTLAATLLAESLKKIDQKQTPQAA